MPDGSKRCEECVCYWVCESPPDSTECKQALEMVESKISSHNTDIKKLPKVVYVECVHCGFHRRVDVVNHMVFPCSGCEDLCYEL